LTENDYLSTEDFLQALKENLDIKLGN